MEVSWSKEVLYYILMGFFVTVIGTGGSINNGYIKISDQFRINKKTLVFGRVPPSVCAPSNWIKKNGNRSTSQKRALLEQDWKNGGIW